MDILSISPVIPVVVIEDAADGVPLARALLAGGIGVIEVTLRTPAALESIRRIAAEVPEMALGAGTILEPAHAAAAADAGAGFLVSPGTTPDVLAGMVDTGLPLLPGVATISEAMALRERGHTQLKLFPAEVVGGTSYLKAISGPLPDLRFCPTGGITLDRVPDYLALPNVACVGGTWIAPAAAISGHDWAGITASAAKTVAACR